MKETYWKIHIWFNKRTEPQNIKLGIDYYNKLKDIFKNSRYTNYSLYDDDRLTFRFQSVITMKSVEDKIIKNLSKEIKDGTILECKIEHVDIPNDIKEAHYFVSEMMLTLPEINKEDLNINFMMYLTNKIYQRYLQKNVFLWHNVRGYSLNFKYMDSTINEYLKRIRIEMNPDKMERILHLLWNCLLIDEEMEKKYWNRFSMDMSIRYSLEE